MEAQRQEKKLKAQMHKDEKEIKKLGKKVNEYKKYIKKVEDTILKKDEKLKHLEMYRKNSEITSTIESQIPRSLEDLENFGMDQQMGRGIEGDRSKNMLNANMDDELEPDLGFAQQPQYDDYDDQFGNQDGGLPNELENNEFNMDNFKGQVNNYNDLGEF